MNECHKTTNICPLLDKIFLEVSCKNAIEVVDINPRLNFSVIILNMSLECFHIESKCGSGCRIGWKSYKKI